MVGFLAAAPVAVRAQIPPPRAEIPTPESILGFAIGTDRKLADWEQITGYLSEVARRSPRVRLDTIGHTTLDRPFVLLTISDPANMARLDELRAVQERLADPRRIESPAARDSLVHRGRVVVLVTAAIHPTEVGSSLVPLSLTYRLASSNEASVRKILTNAIVLIVPSLNPDGVQMVTDWYRSTIDMPWEGASPPFLYHHYVGHDNNRDWYAFTQRETRIVVKQVYARWHPQVVHDIHQQGPRGSRFFLPPWIDPIEPNVDPLLVSATNALGTAIAWDLLREGKSGVVVNATYDAWTPARAFQYYHAGVRILSETASADMASPVEVAFDELEPGVGFDPRRRSWNFPRPWPGGHWGISDIVAYMEAGAMSLLGRVAQDREAWLRGFEKVGERAVHGWETWPRAWVIPGGQTTAAVDEMLRILVTGGVEVEQMDEAFTVDGRTFVPGAHLIDMHQPYASFAETLLETQRYPEIRDAAGQLRRPYDATAHTLPLLLGVHATPLKTRPEARGRLLREPPRPVRSAPGLSRNPAVLVGLYQPWVPSIDEGWTRWVFDQYAVPYATLHNAEVRRGELLRSYTTIVLPSIGADVLRAGWPQGSRPQRYVGGLAGDAVEALRDFVRSGGTLVALDRASEFAIAEFGLPVRDLLRGLDRTKYFAPGSIVGLEVDTTTAVGHGLPHKTAAWLEGGSAFEVPAADGTRVVARYDRAPTLLSGWLEGAAHIAGKPAVVQVSFGRGRVVLFGFRPQYRGQTLATFPLLFNALRASPRGREE